MARFRNHYRCARCHRTWTDEWPATCDDDCPHCGARHMSPYKSEDLADDKVCELNDAFRTTFVGGRVMLTAGVNALADNVKADVLSKVRAFAEFNGDNDPHGEHDFVSVEHEGEKYFGKIDYYAPDMQHGSENPADPKKTMRVLTIMRADEY